MDNLITALMCMLLPGALCLILATGDVLMEILIDLIPGLAEQQAEEIQLIESWQNKNGA